MVSDGSHLPKWRKQRGAGAYEGAISVQNLRWRDSSTEEKRVRCFRALAVSPMVAGRGPSEVAIQRAMIGSVKTLIDRMRRGRSGHLFVANLRIMLGFAFVPAGLKKVLYQPFTEAQNTSAFDDFLHAFYATGVFYQFVGAVQLLIALLLMTQTLTTLGALMALPVITCITVFCWSTGVIPTAIVATMMLLGTLSLILWDVDRWLTILRPEFPAEPSDFSARPLIDLTLWRACGAGILIFFGLSCLVYGGVYRPKGVDLGSPAFYVLPAILLFPVATLIVEQRRRWRSPG